MGAVNAGGDAFAPDPVTNVALVDNDSSAFGFDGQDVTVTWTPATTLDDTFDKYVIYLLPASTDLDTVSHTPFAQVFGGQNISSFSASPSRTKDSAGNDLADGSYQAFVMAVDWAMNKSVAVASTPATLTGETSIEAGEDEEPPMIMSMPAWSFQAGANATILAHIFDNRDLDSSTPTQLKWRVNGGGAFTAVTGTEVTADSGLFSYVIPWDGSWSTSTELLPGSPGCCRKLQLFHHQPGL